MNDETMQIIQFSVNTANEHGIEAAIIQHSFVHYRYMSKIQDSCAHDPSHAVLFSLFPFWSKSHICDLIKYCIENELI